MSQPTINSLFAQGAVMSSEVSMLKSITLTAALVVAVSGMACADDSSMNPFIGDSYAAFNGGNLPKRDNPAYDNAPSAWRLTHPSGLSEREFQSLTTFAPMVYKPAPVFDSATSVWRQSHPNGLSERELQALGSEASAWHPSDKSATDALASTHEATDLSSATEPFGARIARFFHVTPVDQAAPVH
jgi:hypothetical protein